MTQSTPTRIDGRAQVSGASVASADPSAPLDSTHLLAAALPHLESVSRSLASMPHAIRLLDASGKVLHSRASSGFPTEPEPGGPPRRVTRAEVHAASGTLLGVVELDVPVASPGPLAAGLTEHLARSIERDLAAEMIYEFAERRQQDQEAALRLAAIVESSEDAIIGKDLDGIITNWNGGAERMYGYRPDEVVGRHVSLLTIPGEEEEIEGIMRRLRRGERIVHYETQRMRKNGETIQVALSISPIRNPEGKIVGASTIARDITELKRAEHTLRMTEKLAATGRLAASIAHEINNPMASVTNLLYLLQHHPTLDEGAREYVKLAQEELERVTHIVRQMLGFYREAEAPVPVSVKEVLDNVLLLYDRKLRNAHIKVERQYSYDGTVKAFPGEVRQVFSNLVVNAIEALTGAPGAPDSGALGSSLGHGGRIVVRVQQGRDWSRPERRGVRVVVADNGCGISDNHRRAIFEPFFTTKGERGTGLGLWVSEGIVRKHGGSIHVRSTDRPMRHGTCFSVFLPEQAEMGSRERLLRTRRASDLLRRKVA